MNPHRPLALTIRPKGPGLPGAAPRGWRLLLVAVLGALAVLATSRPAPAAAAGPGESTLTVSEAGDGLGTVTSSPGGIDCGTDCTQDYPDGTMVTLTAVADAASDTRFAVFDGCIQGADNTCTVTMSQSLSVTVTFKLARYSMSVSKAGDGTGTVTSSPEGIQCGTDCEEAYASGTLVTLTAAASPGSTFAGFNGGGCNGNGLTCTAPMTTLRTVTVSFALVRHSLSVSKAGGGAGTVTSTPTGIDCGSDCSQDYVQGTGVTLTAAADSGSSFGGFSGGGCSAGSMICTVTLDQDQSVTATFTETGPGPGPGGPPPSGGSGPVLSGLSLSAVRFRAARSGGSVARVVGTRVSYRVSVASSVRFTVQRVVAGRRSHGRCVAAKRSNRRAKACRRYVLGRGSFSDRGEVGKNMLRFTGRVARRALKPGRYRLRAVATDAAHHVSLPKYVTFRIARH